MTTTTTIIPDEELLQSFARLHDNQAFTTLVERHAPWLRASAIRQLRDPHLADDAVQIVFILLAQRAHTMNRRQTQKIAGWLFHTLGYTIKNFRRAARTRARHEAALAQTLTDSAEGPTEKSAQELAEVLDAAVARLPEPYRLAILLRFYQSKPFDEIAATLAITEAAARKRIDRALVTLRSHLGPTTNTSLLSASALIGTSTTLTNAIAKTALAAKAGTVPVALASSLKGVTTIMAITKIQTAAIAAALILAVGLPVTYVAVREMSTAPPATPTAALLPDAQASAPSNSPPLATPSVPTSSTQEVAPIPAPYLLADHEALKHIADPPADVRRQMLNKLDPKNMPTEQAGTAVSGMFRQKNGQFPAWTWHSQSFFPLGDVLDYCLDTYPQEIEGDPGNLTLSGDWVVAEDSSLEDRRAAIENILQQQLHQPIKLIYRDVPREVIVLKGTWNYTPSESPHKGLAAGDTIELYESVIHTQAAGAGIGDSRTFLGEFGKYLHQQVVMDAKGFPDPVMWAFNDNPKTAPQNPAAVLDHLAKQTGLTWSKETRTVRRLFIETK